jgi:hypothetical protein
MSYLKTIVRFITKNPGAEPGSRHEFSPVRDERPLERSFMTSTPGSEMSLGRPGTPSRAFQSMFREGTDMSQVSSADYTYPEGQGASEYFLNNIDLDQTTPVQLYDMVNVMVDVLQQTTTLFDRKRIIKIYAADRANGINEDAFYQLMTGAPGAAAPQPLRSVVGQLVGRPGVPPRPLVIVVQLEQVTGGSRRRRKSTRKSRRR